MHAVYFDSYAVLSQWMCHWLYWN